MTRKQLDRAILRLFNDDRVNIPRVLFPSNLYEYAHALWSKSAAGRRELAKVARQRKARR